MVRKLDFNNLEIPDSKPLWISEDKLAFHSSKVDQLRPTTPVGSLDESKFTPRSGSVTLRQLNPGRKKGL